ncbi:MAG TPA: helix-turn-helix domain-containing protein [Kofleriaceae bacterium]|nr:helix-turn-helix domain-containing protein [Kofleriaceae bacterium]
MKRRVGRPTKPVVTREQVLRAALGILGHKSIDAVTMRGIAKRLHVDPMALYHYFKNRLAVLEAAAALELDSLDVRPATGWRQRLEALAIAYVTVFTRSGELFRYLTWAGEAQRAFDDRFAEAIGELQVKAAAKDAFANVLREFALGNIDARRRRQLTSELDVVIHGMRARR